MTEITEKQGKKMGYILVEDRFFMSLEDAGRYEKTKNIAGSAYRVYGYLRKKRWWEFWK